MKQILVYYILAGDKYESTKASVKLDDDAAKQIGIVEQIFFPIHELTRERIESIHIANDR